MAKQRRRGNGKGKRGVRRRAGIEKMEIRLPLAMDSGHNFLMPVDVNDDQVVRVSDALAIINALARQSADPERESVDAAMADQSVKAMFYDVNDDGQTSPSDAIRVINYLAIQDGAADPAEVLQGSGEARARIELHRERGGRVELEVRLRGGPADQILDVTVRDEVVGQLQTDSQGRGKLEVEFGDDGTAVPDALQNATATTPVEIGDVISGTLGSLGEMEASDGGADAESDGGSDSGADSMSDSGSDASSSSIVFGASTDSTGQDSADDSAERDTDSSDDAQRDHLSDGGLDGPSDDDSSGSSDGGTDGFGDGKTDGGSDGKTDGGSDGDDDRSSD